MPIIGIGIDSATREDKEFGIFKPGFSLVIAESQEVSFNFTSNVYLSTADFQRQISSANSLTIPVSTAVNLNAALKFSSDLKREQDSLITVIRIVGIRKQEKSRINLEQFESDEIFKTAKTLLQEEPYKFCATYGDSFVSKISYGKELAIIIKFDKKSIEAIKKLNLNLEASFPAGFSLNQAIDFINQLSQNQLQCEIFMQTRGFEPNQLPPTDPKELSAIAEWLQNFQTTFSSIPLEQITTPVDFEIKSYGVILPADAKVVVAKANFRAKYYLSIKRCDEVIDFYIKYFNWMNNDEQRMFFELRKQQLVDIQTTLDVNFDLHDQTVIDAVKSLQAMIEELNATKVQQKRINTFNSNAFSNNELDGNFRTDRRVSVPFQIQDIPPGEAPNFSFVINGINIPLQGTLSFHYSLDKNVGFNSGSHRIASSISHDLTVNRANVPPGVGEDMAGVHFAFHYERTMPANSLMNLLSCSPCCTREPEDFTIETYLGCKKPTPILAIN